MLTYLSIKNFALVSHLELEFANSMVVITGETGAGKSILLGALGLALGQRIQADSVRKGSDKAEICAHFSINFKAQSWLETNDIDFDDSEDIMLRRVLMSNGRSRAYINNQSVSANHLKQLATCLIEVHAQHAHQQLLEKETPRKLLDGYGQLTDLAIEVSQAYCVWHKADNHLRNLKENSQQQQAERQLLAYQVQELSELNLQEDELSQLDTEQKQLANAEQRLLNTQQAKAICLGDEGDNPSLSQALYLAVQALGQIDDDNELLGEAKDMLSQASIQIDEAAQSVSRYLDLIDINPHRLAQVEERLSQIYSLARKHQVKPEQLYEYTQTQIQALDALSVSDEQLDELEEQLAQHLEDYEKLSSELHKKRVSAAENLQQAVQNQLSELALGSAKFYVDVSALESQTPQKHGMDEVQLLVQTNSNMPKGSLAKVASGGELSRISLAIQVVTAQTSHTPSLIFDEVDVGIGGSTSERVGRLLAQLGKNCQVMCVTHQAQVAALASQHFQVSKMSGDDEVHTQIRELTVAQREDELARMIGGVEITQATKAHAKEMLASR